MSFVNRKIITIRYIQKADTRFCAILLVIYYGVVRKSTSHRADAKQKSLQERSGDNVGLRNCAKLFIKS